MFFLYLFGLKQLHTGEHQWLKNIKKIIPKLKKTPKLLCACVRWEIIYEQSSMGYKKKKYLTYYNGLC